MAPFQYTPYVNPYVQSISEAMMRGPEAQARAAEIAGQAQAAQARQTGGAWAGAGLLMWFAGWAAAASSTC